MATGRLAEVEEDATYIAEKRFREQIEELAHQQEKAKRAEAKSKTVKETK
jgi:hypothetical protein